MCARPGDRRLASYTEPGDGRTKMTQRRSCSVGRRPMTRPSLLQRFLEEDPGMAHWIIRQSGKFGIAQSFIERLGLNIVRVKLLYLNGIYRSFAKRRFRLEKCGLRYEDGRSDDHPFLMNYIVPHRDPRPRHPRTRFAHVASAYRACGRRHRRRSPSRSRAGHAGNQHGLSGIPGGSTGCLCSARTGIRKLLVRARIQHPSVASYVCRHGRAAVETLRTGLPTRNRRATNSRIQDERAFHGIP